MVLRDLLADVEAVTVREKSATRTLKIWDRIAVRVVRQRDHHVISGALLPFPAGAVELLFDGMRHALKLGKRKQPRLSSDQTPAVCAALHQCLALRASAERTGPGAGAPHELRGGRAALP